MESEVGRPVVVFDPAMRFGYASVRGISADAIGGMVWAGESVDTVAEEYGLTRPQVIVACWYLGLHDTRTWRKRWGEWAKSVASELWHQRYEVPDPPPREQ